MDIIIVGLFILQKKIIVGRDHLHNATELTFAPLRVFGVSSKEAAVKADVTLAVNIAMVMSPNMIQMIEKMRATIDFGDLSP